MRKIAPKLMTGACAVVMVLSVWASPSGAEGRKERDPRSVKAIGKVTSISGSTFNLQTPRRGELRVQYDAQTEWRNLTADVLEVGARVAVRGRLTGDVLRAEVLGSAPPKPRKHAAKKRIAKPHALKGVVTSVKGSGFTLQTRRRKIEVSFNDETTFRGGSAADIQNGAKIAVVPVRPKDAERGSLRRASEVTAKVIGFPKAKGKDRPDRRKDRPSSLKDGRAKPAY